MSSLSPNSLVAFSNAILYCSNLSIKHFWPSPWPHSPVFEGLDSATRGDTQETQPPDDRSREKSWQRSWLQRLTTGRSAAREAANRELFRRDPDLLLCCPGLRKSGRVVCYCPFASGRRHPACPCPGPPDAFRERRRAAPEG